MPAKTAYREEHLGRPIVRIEDWYNPNGYPRLPSGYQGETCVLCGRPIRTPTAFQIIGVGGNTIQICSVDDDAHFEKEDRGYMGGWAVGPDCGRSIRKAIKTLGLDPDKYVIHPGRHPAAGVLMHPLVKTHSLGGSWKIEPDGPLPDGRDVGPQGQPGWRQGWTVTGPKDRSASLGFAVDTGCTSDDEETPIPPSVLERLNRLVEKLTEAGLW